MSMYVEWIKYAKLGTLTIWLEKYDDKYVISDLDIADNSSTYRMEFQTFAEADHVFKWRCKGLPITYRVEPNGEEFDGDWKKFYGKHELHQMP